MLQNVRVVIYNKHRTCAIAAGSLYSLKVHAVLTACSLKNLKKYAA